jgi:hypothetical protein
MRCFTPRGSMHDGLQTTADVQPESPPGAGGCGLPSPGVAGAAAAGASLGLEGVPPGGVGPGVAAPWLVVRAAWKSALSRDSRRRAANRLEGGTSCSCMFIDLNSSSTCNKRRPNLVTRLVYTRWA